MSCRVYGEFKGQAVEVQGKESIRREAGSDSESNTVYCIYSTELYVCPSV